MIMPAHEPNYLPANWIHTQSGLVFTPEELLEKGLRINKETFQTNFTGGYKSNIVNVQDTSDVYMALRLYFNYCKNNPILQGPDHEIKGKTLQKEHLHYSGDGQIEGNYSSKEVQQELIKNLKLIKKIINKHSSFEDIDRIWANFLATHDNYHRNNLIEFYLPIVKYTAERIYTKLPEMVDVDDLISAGIFGLMDAIDAYDPGRGVKFATYSTPRIRGAILDELREMDWMSRLARIRSKHLSKATQSLEMCLGRKPTEQETAEELDITIEQYNQFWRDAHAIGLESLDRTLNGEDDGNALYEKDVISDERSVNPVAEAQKKELKNLLINGLARAERLIIILYYYEEMNNREIGEVLGLSESRVSQLHSSILSRLKAKIYEREDEMMGRKRTDALEYLKKITTYISVTKFVDYLNNKIGVSPDISKRIISEHPTLKELIESNPDRKGWFRIRTKNIETLTEEITRLTG